MIVEFLLSSSSSVFFFPSPLTTVSASPWRGSCSRCRSRPFHQAVAEVLAPSGIKPRCDSCQSKPHDTLQHIRPEQMSLYGLQGIIPASPTKLRTQTQPFHWVPNARIVESWRLELVAGVDGLIVGTRCIGLGSRVCRLMLIHSPTCLLAIFKLSRRS